ncbi:MAG: hypothetical protein KDA42_15095 [Planctomycetales bacterium]|nr:hypothetical protein [Planctomycetales bacterium]
MVRIWVIFALSLLAVMAGCGGNSTPSASIGQTPPKNTATKKKQPRTRIPAQPEVPAEHVAIMERVYESAPERVESYRYACPNPESESLDRYRRMRYDSLVRPKFKASIKQSETGESEESIKIEFTVRGKLSQFFHTEPEARSAPLDERTLFQYAYFIEFIWHHGAWEMRVAQWRQASGGIPVDMMPESAHLAFCQWLFPYEQLTQRPAGQPDPTTVSSHAAAN